MLPRYFNDIYILDKFSKSKKIKALSHKLHHKEDLKFSFIIYILLNVSKIKLFYEYGQTLMEKIFFINFFSNYFKTKNLGNIKWRGNDISEIFNFFCKNFYKNYKVKVFKEFNKKNVKNSVFFSKGVTLLYIKNNIKLLNNVIQSSKCGCFDLSIVKKKQNQYLNTGKILFFPTINQFNKILKNSNKKFIIRNIKKNGNNKIYLEVIFGTNKIISKFEKEIEVYKKKFSFDSNLIKLLGLNLKNITKFTNYK